MGGGGILVPLAVFGFVWSLAPKRTPLYFRTRASSAFLMLFLMCGCWDFCSSDPEVGS